MSKAEPQVLVTPTPKTHADVEMRAVATLPPQANVAADRAPKPGPATAKDIDSDLFKAALRTVPFTFTNEDEHPGASYQSPFHSGKPTRKMSLHMNHVRWRKKRLDRTLKRVRARESMIRQLQSKHNELLREASTLALEIHIGGQYEAAQLPRTAELDREKKQLRETQEELRNKRKRRRIG